MNNKMIRYVLANILKLEAVFMIVPLLLSMYYQEKTLVSFAHLLTILLLWGTSCLLSGKQPENVQFLQKRGCLLLLFPGWLFLFLELFLFLSVGKFLPLWMLFLKLSGDLQQQEPVFYPMWKLSPILFCIGEVLRTLLEEWEFWFLPLLFYRETIINPYTL